MSITTMDLVPGDRVRLLEFGSTPLSYRRRLLAMGLVRNVLARVVRKAPLGCPIQLEINGISLLLRKKEACALSWERL